VNCTAPAEAQLLTWLVMISRRTRRSPTFAEIGENENG
jgi:hypothetical protein